MCGAACCSTSCAWHMAYYWLESMQCHVQLPHSCLYSMLYMSCERVLQMRLLGDGALRDALELRRVKLAIGKNIAKKIPTHFRIFNILTISWVQI